MSVSRAVTDWELDADNAKSLTFGGLFDSEIDIDNRIDGISVKGWSVAKGQEIPTFTSGSTIAADFIKSASLFNWDTTDMTQLLVPEVGDIAALTYTDTRPASKTKWTWKPGQPEKWSNAIEPIEYVG